jgi:hypothetical protein
VVKILSVGEDQEVAVIGTLYKDMKLKPSILDEYAKQPGFKQALGGTGEATSRDCRPSCKLVALMFGECMLCSMHCDWRGKHVLEGSFALHQFLQAHS